LVVHEEKVRGQVSFRRVRVFHLLRFLHLLRGFRWSLGHFVYVLFLKTVSEEKEERSDEMVSLAVLI
jgi:glutaredoxin 2